MKKKYLALVLATIISFSTVAQTYIEMASCTTNKNIGDYFSISVGTFSAGSFAVDYGDGVKVTKTTSQNIDYEDFSDIIKGPTIKIYKIDNEPDIRHLSVNYNELTDLDVSKCLLLEVLDFTRNELTSIDISANTLLEKLVGDENKLTNIDVSNNPDLKVLNVSMNQLTSLNISNNTKLISLNCYYNNINGLDISNNLDLDFIWCFKNKIESLDVKNHIKLGVLRCEDNLITSLDIRHNTKLTELSCGNNFIGHLDVTNNLLLESLACNNTINTPLDVSKNIKLTNLLSEGNQLTQIDLSNNVNLTFISVQNNLLTKLDLSNGTSVQNLFFSENKISELNLGSNNLVSIYGSNNKLTNIDVSYCTNMTNLNVSQNNLTSLDVSINTELQELWVSSNKLTNLDISNNTKLVTLQCGDNYLTQLDISSHPTLIEINCSENNMPFSKLPQIKDAFSYYYYSPQNKMPIPDTITLIKSIDLSSEYSILDKDGNTNITDYKWKTITDEYLIEGTDYIITNGITKFLKVQKHKVFCEMRNASFPEFGTYYPLITTEVKVEPCPNQKKFGVLSFVGMNDTILPTTGYKFIRADYVDVANNSDIEIKIENGKLILVSTSNYVGKIPIEYYAENLAETECENGEITLNKVNIDVLLKNSCSYNPELLVNILTNDFSLEWEYAESGTGIWETIGTTQTIKAIKSGDYRVKIKKTANNDNVISKTISLIVKATKVNGLDWYEVEME